jgi:ubiquitin carboxyl-terminal hydrolase 5/13
VVKRLNQINLMLLPGVEEIDSSPLENCINRFFGIHEVEQDCTKCLQKTMFHRTVRFLSFPKLLMMSLHRFTFADWIPKKMKTDLIMEDVPLDLEAYKIKGGLQEGEQELPEEAFDEAMVAEVMEMGIPELGAKHALLGSGNTNSQAAIAWYFDNFDNPILTEPFPEPKPDVEVNEEALKMFIESMGFSREKSIAALIKCDNNGERACDYLMSYADEERITTDAKVPIPESAPGVYSIQSLITHLGNTPQIGHYVTHVKRNNEWILFNDNKVASTTSAPLAQAHLYFWQQHE